MRTRSLAVSLAVGLVMAVALAACATNPDPRHRTLEQVQRDGRGGWIVITPNGGVALAGELIAVEPGALRVLAGDQLIEVPRGNIAKAELWPWPASEGVFAAWGALGTLSTVSHGYFLGISAPIWLVTTLVTSITESSASLVAYPHDDWGELVKWARFPQGLPPGVGAPQLGRAVAPPAGPSAPR